jgi:predicted O-methyltransferase YrrM
MLRVAIDESIASEDLEATAGQPNRPGQATAPATQYALSVLVRLLAPARVLEIGTFFADTARVIAAAMAETGTGHLTTIDPFGADRVPDVIAGWPAKLRERVTFRPDNSMSFFLYLDEELHVKRGMQAPFDIIFVDGHHSFDYAFFDLMRSTLFLRPGGALVVDNIEQPGPAEAVRLFLERHTHWQLYKAPGAEPSKQDLGFHRTANSAIILAPDGIEIGSLPYRIDLYDLPLWEVREAEIKIQNFAPGVLRALVNFYARPADYSVTGTGEQGCIGVAEYKIDVCADKFVVIKYDPALRLVPHSHHQVAAQIELSFAPENRSNLLIDADPIRLR